MMELQQNPQDLVVAGGAPAEVPNDPGYVTMQCFLYLFFQSNKLFIIYYLEAVKFYI